MTRVDALLAELAARHGNQEPFLTAVRPLVERILEPGLTDDRRVHLLEFLAETCERDVAIRANGERARRAWVEFFEHLKQIVLRLSHRASEAG